MASHRSNTAYLFLLFPLGILLVFTLVPTLLALGLSLFSWDGGPDPRWVGLKNFTDLASDAKFGPALFNTVAYVAGVVPPMVVIGFLLAAAVNARWFKGRVLVRTLFFLPTILSIVAIGYVWRWLLEPEAGLVNWALRLGGVASPPDWLNDETWALPSIIVVTVWRGIGFCMVIYLASLATINRSLYEAAEVDGATPGQVLRHITWPQVAPTTAFLFITGVIGSLQVFDIIFVMTGQAENDATNVLNLYIYRLFTYGQLGYAAAVGVVILAITMLATAGQLAWATRGQRAGRAAT
jgi:multiple sugar transport system permease protein